MAWSAGKRHRAKLSLDRGTHPFPTRGRARASGHRSIPVWLRKAIGKPTLFALSNGWAKYYQVERNRRLGFEHGEF